MSTIINCVAYMALVYESCVAVLNVLHMVKFSKTMNMDMIDVMIQLESMCKLICFSILAFGVITRYKLMVKVWLLLSYCQINWGGVGKLFVNVYEYFFSEKYKDKAEFMQQMSEAYASLVGQVLTQIGIILMIYRFYQSMEPPKKIKGPLTPVPAEEKAK